jgi:hypothetical protein
MANGSGGNYLFVVTSWRQILQKELARQEWQ